MRPFDVIDNDIRRMRATEKQIERQNIEALKRTKEEIDALFDEQRGEQGSSGREDTNDDENQVVQR